MNACLINHFQVMFICVKSEGDQQLMFIRQLHYLCKMSQMFLKYLNQC